MKKDIDAILEEQTLELVLGGKTYEVRDIKVDTFLSFINNRGKKPEERDDVRRQLESALGLENGELENVGLRAATLAFDAVNEWLRGESKPTEEDEQESHPSI